MADIRQLLPFKKFGSIKNTDSPDGKKMLAAYGEVDAVAMEKAHGAHFSFQTNGKYIECARRRDVLGPDDHFYNYQDFAALYTEQIIRIYEEITSMLENITSIQIDGEFIGGSYSHPDVKKHNGCSKVQAGVSYCPGHKFFAYDIHCFRTEPDGTISSFYVDYYVAESIFKKVDILYAEPVARGTFAELCEMSNVFESIISGVIGLPTIDKNAAEGLVIRPTVERVNMQGSRIILKSKNEQFNETIRTKSTEKKSQKRCPMIDPEIALCIDSMVTLNRLESVISKIGEVTRADFGKLMGGLNCDVLEEFPQTYPDVHASIDEKVWPSVKKYLNNKCSGLISKYFVTR